MGQDDEHLIGQDEAQDYHEQQPTLKEYSQHQISNKVQRQN